VTLAAAAVTAGWVLLSENGTGTAADAAATRNTLFWIRASDGSTVAPVINDAGDHVIAWAMCFRYAKITGNPFDVLNGVAVDAVASTAVSTPGGTTLVDNCLVLETMAHATGSASPSFALGVDAAGMTFTERGDGGATTGNGGSAFVISSSKVSAGAFGATTGTLLFSDTHAYISVALRPTITEIDADSIDPSAVTYSGGAGHVIGVAASYVDYAAPGGGGGGATVTYRMRGKVSGVPVYWSSSEIDTDASDYLGGGTVTDIVVVNVIGA